MRCFKFSRRHEEKADVTGAQMMAQLLRPADMVAFFEILRMI
jgi:hypothetical protein